jgi:hypothetical protein
MTRGKWWIGVGIVWLVLLHCRVSHVLNSRLFVACILALLDKIVGSTDIQYGSIWYDNLSSDLCLTNAFQTTLTHLYPSSLSVRVSNPNGTCHDTHWFLRWHGDNAFYGVVAAWMLGHEIGVEPESCIALYIRRGDACNWPRRTCFPYKDYYYKGVQASSVEHESLLKIDSWCWPMPTTFLWKTFNNYGPTFPTLWNTTEPDIMWIISRNRFIPYMLWQGNHYETLSTRFSEVCHTLPVLYRAMYLVSTRTHGSAPVRAFYVQVVWAILLRHHRTV